MKRLFSFILSIVFLTSSVGATISLHYCMDELVSWSFLNKEDNKCENCGMEKEDGCCKDELKYVKNNTDQKKAEELFQTSPAPAIAITKVYSQSTEFYASLIEESPVCNAPPINSDVDICIRNCVFRI